MTPFVRWLCAFALTEAIEIPFYLAALRRAEPRALGARFTIAFGASLLTHPVVWFVFPELWPDSYVAMALFAEAFAIGAEALYLRAFRVPHALGWSLAANATSALTGLALLALRGATGWL